MICIEFACNFHAVLAMKASMKWHKQRKIINLVSPIGNTNQRMGVHGPQNISEVESGAMEEKASPVELYNSWKPPRQVLNKEYLHSLSLFSYVFLEIGIVFIWDNDWKSTNNESHKSCRKYKIENRGNRDLWIHQRWDHVPRRSKHPIFDAK
jgi:hypothetical protein